MTDKTINQSGAGGKLHAEPCDNLPRNMPRMNALRPLLIFAWLQSAAAASPFDIKLVRQVMTNDLVVGEISVNDVTIGKVYENKYFKISAGNYPGHLRYASSRDVLPGPNGALAHEGDFLLEVSGGESPSATNRATILLHGGNEAYPKEGCLMLSPLDPKKGKAGTDHPLHQLRLTLYGAEGSTSAPNKQVEFEIQDRIGTLSGFWLAEAPRAQVIRNGVSCQHEITFDHVLLVFKGNNSSTIADGVLSYQFTEKSTGICPHTPIPATYHFFTIRSGRIQSNKVEISFAPACPDSAPCIVDLTGTLQDFQIRGALRVQRADQEGALPWKGFVSLAAKQGRLASVRDLPPPTNQPPSAPTNLRLVPR